MKDFIIDVVTAKSSAAAAVVAQSSGTVSSRPLVSKIMPRGSLGEAAFTGLIESLKDLSRFLNEGDHVDALLSCTDGSAKDLTTKGSGNKRLDAEFRKLILDYNKKGVSIYLTPATVRRDDLAQKAALSLSLGM